MLVVKSIQIRFNRQKYYAYCTFSRMEISFIYTQSGTPMINLFSVTTLFFLSMVLLLTMIDYYSPLNFTTKNLHCIRSFDFRSLDPNSGFNLLALADIGSSPNPH